MPQRNAHARPEIPDPPGLGFPRPLWRALDRLEPPRALTHRAFRSPLRGPWLTSVFALVLLVGLPVVAVTGLLSWIAYGPGSGQAIPAVTGGLHLPLFEWPASPSWLYRLTQGLHVGLGLTLIPVVLAKLWSVVPTLFRWPPARSLAQVLERVTLLALVGGMLFEIVTGVLNIQYDYVFGFSFYTAHYWGAWVFLAGLGAHTVLKLPAMVHSLRSRSLRAELRTPLAGTAPETPDRPHDLVAEEPATPTMSRRMLFGVVGGGALGVAALSVGQTVDALRPAALLAPRGVSYGDGPNDFQVNRTAVAAGITPARTAAWSLRLTGGSSEMRLGLDELRALPQHTATLPIACVEGWSTTRVWTGVRLRDLAEAIGVAAPVGALVSSLEQDGPFSRAVLQGNQVRHPDSLLALQVGGADLSPDHGFPARIIVPAIPGVHATKWVASLDFRSTR